MIYVAYKDFFCYLRIQIDLTAEFSIESVFPSQENTWLLTQDGRLIQSYLLSLLQWMFLFFCQSQIHSESLFGRVYWHAGWLWRWYVKPSYQKLHQNTISSYECSANHFVPVLMNHSALEKHLIFHILPHHKMTLIFRNWGTQKNLTEKGQVPLAAPLFKGYHSRSKTTLFLCQTLYLM